MGVVEIDDFITYIVNQKAVSASTQNQAISAILFLYRNVLQIQLNETALISIRPTKHKRIPTVLSKDVKTTMIYTHVLRRGSKAVHSPLDD
jgi:site-specific recombinase XerD